MNTSRNVRTCKELDRDARRRRNVAEGAVGEVCSQKRLQAGQKTATMPSLSFEAGIDKARRAFTAEGSQSSPMAAPVMLSFHSENQNPKNRHIQRRQSAINHQLVNPRRINIAIKVGA